MVSRGWPSHARIWLAFAPASDPASDTRAGPAELTRVTRPSSLPANSVVFNGSSLADRVVHDGMRREIRELKARHQLHVWR